MWVQLSGQGESEQRVRPRSAVSFTGSVVPHGPAYAREMGVTAREGGAELRRQGHHLRVARRSLQVNP